MFPLPIAGLTAAGVSLISKYRTKSHSNRNNYMLKPSQTKKYRLQDALNSLNKPVQSLIKNLRSKVSETFSKPTKIDYDSIVSTYLPAGAQVMAPKYPIGSGRYLISDLDNDSDDEIIVTYKLREEIRTMILRKQNSGWYKASEVTHSGYSNLHYRSIGSLSEDNKKQLLIGVSEAGKPTTLLGYELVDNNIRTIFNHYYQKLELIEKKNRNTKNVKHELAIWEKDSTNIDTFNINVFSLKDSQLYSSNSLDSYYYKRVLPYYARSIKRSPYNTASWYNLAKALVRINYYDDANVAINIGSRIDTSSRFKERFEDLRRSMNN